VSEPTAARKSPIVMRSAVGLGATLAVVGVVAPNISSRALATNVDVDAADVATTSAPSVLPAAPPAALESLPEAVSDDPLMMLTTFSEPAQTLPAPEIFHAYAPRTIAFVTPREAAAPLASLTEIDAVLGEAMAAAWREAKKGPAQLASADAPAKDDHASVADHALGE
jgi:hypothetical protein